MTKIRKNGLKIIRSKVKLLLTVCEALKEAQSPIDKPIFTHL
ncbi:hypothetical protein RV00_GL001158 [Enterococcus devriesei]|uniref:Uncharacterized protein n=1 Tax=Enterococcus devriesei TaxID=319970 RepID=A0A1L8SXK9_9ENTE|nr:hypothetical protein RV00_GL001158 [Enterococcus devriesei]